MDFLLDEDTIGAEVVDQMELDYQMAVNATDGKLRLQFIRKHWPGRAEILDRFLNDSVKSLSGLMEDDEDEDTSELTAVSPTASEQGLLPVTIRRRHSI